ncbi:class I SAM-dependent methyltransferase [Scytonema sp. UIC 10036]|uniref:class I SAM-dependent methyltransferase n=1 Tax=Scytonema sp. UIC 10036 TaxID=2304196 RepID=UPI0012DABFD6|nr:class I SAM-dependent methyltransferase [Scytonema sp. UIC 10036]MUG94037.1 class I SAM-dependent methyltransferase [Scytonema sp. UIC 10036]
MIYYIQKIVKKIINYILNNSDIGSKIMAFPKEVYEINLKTNSQNIEYQLNLNSLKSTVDYVEHNLTYAQPLSNFMEICDHALTKVSLIDGLFCEFGVYKGGTINYIASKINCQIHGFDSFEGLPEFWRSGYDTGAFKVEHSKLPIFNPNVCLHIGLFEDTLKNFVEEYKQPIAFLHIDCDLYSSTKTILDYLVNRIREGTIIVFNEYFNYPGWQQHEFKAFQEFVKINQITYEYLCYNQYHEQVAVIITHFPSLNKTN